MWFFQVFFPCSTFFVIKNLMVVRSFFLGGCNGFFVCLIIVLMKGHQIGLHSFGFATHFPQISNEFRFRLHSEIGTKLNSRTLKSLVRLSNPDPFPAGCIIAQLFLDGDVLFNLPDLLAYACFFCCCLSSI